MQLAAAGVTSAGCVQIFTRLSMFQITEDHGETAGSDHQIILVIRNIQFVKIFTVIDLSEYKL